MRKISKGLREFVSEAKKSDVYWIEKTKVQFALALEKQRRAAGLTYAAVAEKLGTSAAYITKVFRGDSNVTIESMVKLAHATGGRVDIRIVDAAVADAHWDAASLVSRVGGFRITAPSATAAIPFDVAAANHAAFERELVA